MGNQLRELAAAGPERLARQHPALDVRVRRTAEARRHRPARADVEPDDLRKAIGTGTDYDEQLKSSIGSEHDAQNLFEALAIQDIHSACDVFAPVFKSTSGLDGYVSLEVSPTLAHDTKATTDAAQRLCGKRSTGRT